MPNYTFHNNETDETWNDHMSYDELKSFLKENPHINQVFTAIPIADPTRVGIKTKPDDGFRDLLKDMKKKHSRGITKSSINTF